MDDVFIDCSPLVQSLRALKVEPLMVTDGVTHWKPLEQIIDEVARKMVEDDDVAELVLSEANARARGLSKEA